MFPCQFKNVFETCRYIYNHQNVDKYFYQRSSSHSTFTFKRHDHDQIKKIKGCIFVGIYHVCHVPVWAVFQKTLLLHFHFLCPTKLKIQMSRWKQVKTTVVFASVSPGSWRQIWIYKSSADDNDIKWTRLCDVILSLMSLAEGQVHTVWSHF